MNTVDLNKYPHDYKPHRNLIFRIMWYYTNLIFFKSSFPINSVKIILLKIYGAKLRKNIVLKPNINIKYPWNLKIGDNCWIGEGVWIDNLELVEIGNNVCISQGALLLTGNHNYKLPTFDYMGKPIKIEDGVWIGAKSVVCPGVTCHSHSILTVGSVANRKLDSYSIYSGIPAVEVKKREIL